MTLRTILYVILGALASIIFLIYWKLIRPSKRLYDIYRKQGISCEPFVPLLGQMLDLYRVSQNDTAIDYRWKLVQKHGYTYGIGFGPMINLLIMEPDLLADVFGRSHAQYYIKPIVTKTLKPLIGTRNLLVSEGDEHERARKMLNPAFHFVKLQSMIPIMVQQTHKAIDELLSCSSQCQVINLQKELTALTLAIIAAGAFGKDFEATKGSKEIVCRAFTEMLNAITYRTMRLIDSIPIISQLPFWYKDVIDRDSQAISNFVDQIIADRQQKRSMSLTTTDDLLDLLLSAVDSEGRSFDDQEIKDQALTFVLAGHETTGNLMIWVVYVLMTNEKVLQACQEEVDRVLPNGTELTNEHLNQMPVCEAVLQETLRLYPSAPFITRRCAREHHIGSEGERQILVPVGAELTVNTYILHRREEYWPRANEFDYTRWMRDPVTDLKPKLAHPFCYLPFAAGPRNCIGQNFALLEARVMLALLVQRCNFELEPGQKIVPDIHIAMRPKYGLRARVTRRIRERIFSS